MSCCIFDASLRALTAAVAKTNEQLVARGSRQRVSFARIPFRPEHAFAARESRLWGFDYTWEVYTPPAKRKRGYYALPILAGTELVGHVDAKANRATRRLEIASRRVRRGHKVTAAVKELAGFLHLGR